ncbi:VOC family protein [Paractinoplanes deccanensis]|uniref:VOC family protein n=1 Tax=Paractinoplanes deccanensis TaxID=113561 RepID=A0ABQ3XZM1_9ACTN|nr:VOC family protein [Actinoplanes deccanensis]GID73194.1 VOC family protein [Actinoplanes deccanensis]
MASQLNPYLTFDGNAREALDFYKSVFGGDLAINTYGDFGAPDPTAAGRIMHGRLDTPQGYTIMAADAPPGSTTTFGDNVVCSLSGDAGEGLEDVWDKLSPNAEIEVPFEKQMWGDTFGQLKDRYGIHWMVNVTGQ